MTLFVPSAGKRITQRAIVTTTAPNILINSSDKAFLYTVESLSVRLLGTDTSFDFTIDDGTLDSVVAGADGFGAETFWHLTDHHVTVPYGSELRFTAGGATEMHVTVVALETDTSGQGQK